MTRDKQLVAQELVSRGLNVATMHMADGVVRAQGGRTPYSTAVRALGTTTSHRLHATRPARTLIHTGRQATHALDHVDFHRSNNRILAGNVARHAIVGALLRQGADPDGKNGIPLFRAIFNNDVVLVNMLIKAGADVNVTHSRYGWRPVMEAADFPGFHDHGSAYRVGCLRALLMAKATPNIHDTDGKTPLMSVCEPQTQYEFENQEDEIIPVPAIYGQTKRTAVRLLLDAKANPNTQDDKGWTALHYTLWPRFEWLSREQEIPPDINIVRMLLDAGADPTIGGSIVSWIQDSGFTVSADIMRLLK